MIELVLMLMLGLCLGTVATIAAVAALAIRAAESGLTRSGLPPSALPSSTDTTASQASWGPVASGSPPTGAKSEADSSADRPVAAPGLVSATPEAQEVSQGGHENFAMRFPQRSFTNCSFCARFRQKTARFLGLRA